MRYAFPDTLNEKAKAVVELCRTKQVKLSTIESCTGGLLSGCITDIPGYSPEMRPVRSCRQRSPEGFTKKLASEAEQNT